MKVLFIWPNKDSFGFKPIGLSLLSAIAREIGWETRLFDTSEIDLGFIGCSEAGQQAKIFKPIDMVLYGHKKKKTDLRVEFLKVMEEFQPDCLAFSVLSDEALIAAEITFIAKELFPKLPVIWGGKYPTLQPE